MKGSGLDVWLWMGVLVCLVQSTMGREVYVNVTYSGPGNPSGKIGDPFTSVQDALDSTFHGDVIIIFPGTYTGTGNTNLYIGNQIDLRALDTSDRPIFDLSGSNFAVWNPYLPNSTVIGSIDGLVFINGAATGSAASVLEVRNGSLNVINCVFNSSVAEDGSAVVLSTTTGDPGSSLVTFEKCTFNGNRANSGAALKAYYNKWRTVVIQNSIFTSNIASVSGGAVYSDHVSLLISRSQFTANVASLNGGALFAETTNSKLRGTALHVVVLNSAFTSNSAGSYGGALALTGGAELDLSFSQVTSNTLLSTSNLSQSGAGVYVSGSVVFDSVTVQSNMCGGLYNLSYGGGLYLAGGDVPSFIRASTFQSNGCKFGSDFAAVSGSLYAASITVNRNFNPNQIAASGSAFVRIIDGTFNEKKSNTLHSLLVEGSSTLSFDFTLGGSYVFTIAQMVVSQNGKVLSSSHLSVTSLVFDGGSIQGTYTDTPLSFTVTESGIVSEDVDPLVTTLELSGFKFVLNGTLIIGKATTFFVTDYFYNNGQLYVQEAATVSARDGDSPVSFFNYGEINVNSTASINCNFYDQPGSTIIMSNVGITSKQSLIVLGGAALEGNLKLSFSDTGLKDFDDGNSLRIIRYLELFRSPFANVVTIPTRTIYLDYTPTDVYISNGKKKGETEGGLDGGDVAGIVIAVVIGLGALTLAAWYFIIRPQSEQLYQEEVLAHQQVRETHPSQGEGYGAL